MSNFLYACKHNDIETVRKHLSGDVDLKQCNSKGRTALQIAVKHGYHELVKVLIGAGADVNDTGMTNEATLSLAFKTINDWRKNYDRNVIVTMLLNAGFKFEKDDDYLFLPAMYGLENVVKTLIAFGADVNVDDGMPLSTACRYGQYTIAKILIESGADVNIRDGDVNAEHKDGYTPLEIATKEEYDDIIELLKEHGAK